MKTHTVKLDILSADPYKKFLELIIFDYAGVSYYAPARAKLSV